MNNKFSYFFIMNPSQTDITIGDNQFQFTFLPTVDSIKTVASEFCINNQEVLGIAPLTEETLGDCHNPIATRLRDVAVQYVESQSGAATTQPQEAAAAASPVPVADSVVEEEEDGTVVIQL